MIHFIVKKNSRQDQPENCKKNEPDNYHYTISAIYCPPLVLMIWSRKIMKIKKKVINCIYFKLRPLTIFVHAKYYWGYTWLVYSCQWYVKCIIGISIAHNEVSAAAWDEWLKYFQSNNRTRAAHEAKGIDVHRGKI